MRLVVLVPLLIGVAGNAVAQNAPSILNNSGHAVATAVHALNVLGISHQTNVGPSAGTLVVNQTCAGNCSTFLSAAAAIGRAKNIFQTEYGAGSTSLVVPSVPYQVINQSSTGYTVASFDQSNYSALSLAGIVYSMAYCGSPAVNDYPPIAFVTVLPNHEDATPVGGFGCGYAKGIEFSIPATNNCLPSCAWMPIGGGISININAPSDATAAMSAVLAALKSHHPSWTWGDVKSVLRATASNWSTGYTPFNSVGPAFGYGNIDYVAANAYSGTIYLQPPGFALTATDTAAILTLYPFKTSRRAGEVVYAFSSRPTFPNPSTANEYSYTQVAALVSAHGGSLIYNSNGADGVQSINYSAPASEERFSWRLQSITRRTWPRPIIRERRALSC